ncbi:hypothetical protein ACMYR3_06055 [Ampullimonas aquatilis]|uniref:hypothetical protein n=1 Tax=Ampullimonas aquatilis TaxID=1341549 RepID=UPI003C716468
MTAAYATIAIQAPDIPASRFIGLLVDSNGKASAWVELIAQTKIKMLLEDALDWVESVGGTLATTAVMQLLIARQMPDLIKGNHWVSGGAAGAYVNTQNGYLGDLPDLRARFAIAVRYHLIA